MICTRKYILFGLASLVALGSVLWLRGYQPAHASAEPKRATRPLTDLTGRTLQVPEQPRHILSLCSSATATLLALQAKDHLAAIDEFSRVVPGTEEIPVIGKGSAVSIEQVTARQIDLAFVWWYQDDAAETLNRLNVPVVRIPNVRAHDLPVMIRLVGECVQSRTQAETLVTKLDPFFRSINLPTSSSLDRPRVYVELYGPYKTSGRDTYLNDLLELAGATNVAAELKGSVLLSAERLAQLQPDLILCAGQTDLASLQARPGMSDLKAVQAGRVAALDRRLLVAGPNLPQTVEELRSQIHRINGK